jgi:starvation-inducible DNA-binding protein
MPNTLESRSRTTMKNTLHRTKNDLPEASRTKAVELLSSRLSSCIDLYMQTKQAHWTVKGPTFIALHELFDKVGESVEDSVDEIAERIVQLGGTPKGTSQVVAKETSLKPYPLDITNGTDHVDALSSALSAFGSQARSAIALATELDDADTADLFTQISREIDKQLWFVEAHAQAKS